MPDDVGRHEVRRELDPLELDAERAGERLHRQGLGQPGHALDQQMAPGHEGDDHPLEQHVLADDDPLDVVQHLLEEASGSPLPDAGPLHWADAGFISAGAPAARPAVAIGTAKPMPAKLSVPAGLARPVTIPIT